MLMVSSSSSFCSTAWPWIPVAYENSFLIPLDSAKLQVLGDGFIFWSAFISLFLKYMSDEKRER
jgi:hypothetical protein